MDPTKPADAVDITPTEVEQIDTPFPVVDITPNDVNLIPAKREERVFALGKPDNRHYRRALRAHNRKAEKAAKKKPKPTNPKEP